MNLATVAALTPVQTLPLAAVFQAAGHLVGYTPAEQHAFVVQRLIALVQVLK